MRWISRRGGNFGALTGSRPAAAMAAIGCNWALIGHSEERRDILSLMSACSKAPEEELHVSLGSFLGARIGQALGRGLNVLYCVGEPARESLENMPDNALVDIKRQLQSYLSISKNDRDGASLVIAYEPIWAIGPGKIPPGADYIDAVASLIQRHCLAHSLPADVVYGGGLKLENAATIGNVATVRGGLVALTRFSPPIGFNVAELVNIINAFVGAGKR